MASNADTREAMEDDDVRRGGTRGAESTDAVDAVRCGRGGRGVDAARSITDARWPPTDEIDDHVFAAPRRGFWPSVSSQDTEDSVDMDRSGAPGGGRRREGASIAR